MDPVEASGALQSAATAAVVSIGLSDNRQIGADNTIIPGMAEAVGTMACNSSAVLVD